MQSQAPINPNTRLGNDEEQNYDLYISEIQTTGKVWGLKAKDSCAVCLSP